jgi:hypothetical protein
MCVCRVCVDLGLCPSRAGRSDSGVIAEPASQTGHTELGTWLIEPQAQARAQAFTHKVFAAAKNVLAWMGPPLPIPDYVDSVHALKS